MDLEWFVMPALSTGQFSIADAQSKTVGYSLPIGVVLWARVSPEVDKRLAANLDQPVRLKPDEWTSGDIYWLMEAVGDSRVIGPMLKGLGTSEVLSLANPGPPLTQAVIVPPNANKVDNRLVLSYVPCAVGESRRRRTRVGAKSAPRRPSRSSKPLK